MMARRATNAKRARKQTVSKRKKQSAHPKYVDMIQIAISNLRRRQGSSRQAILKYICAKYKIKHGALANRYLKMALKRGVQKGLLKQTKGIGANGSFKLGENKQQKTRKIQRFPTANSRKANFLKKSKNKCKRVVTKSAVTTKTSTRKVAKQRKYTTQRRPAQRKDTKPTKKSRVSTPKKAISRKTKVIAANRTSKVESRTGPFNIKLSDDTEDCDVYAVELTTDGRVVIADKSNKKIKMFNMHIEYQSSLSLPFPPSDVAVLNTKEAIVSLWSKNKLYILNINKLTPTIKETIELTYSLIAITSYEDKIIGCSWEETPSVKLMDKRGNVYWSRCLDDDGNPLFDIPAYNICCLVNERPVIFVTDYGAVNSVTKLDFATGDVIKICKKPRPVGITNDNDNMVYVCYETRRVIVSLSPDLGGERVKVSFKDGIDPLPSCIKFNKFLNQLMVSYDHKSFGRNYIHCFNMS